MTVYELSLSDKPIRRIPAGYDTPPDAPPDGPPVTFIDLTLHPSGTQHGTLCALIDGVAVGVPGRDKRSRKIMMLVPIAWMRAEWEQATDRTALKYKARMLERLDEIHAHLLELNEKEQAEEKAEGVTP